MYLVRQLEALGTQKLVGNTLQALTGSLAYDYNDDI